MKQEKEIMETAKYVADIVKGLSKDEKEAEKVMQEIGKYTLNFLSEKYNEKEPAYYIS